MNEVVIEIYSDIYKDSVASLILDIQNNEFEIPISLDMQPDLNEISKFYQRGNGNFWIAKLQNKIVGTISLLDIGHNRAALRKMFVVKEYRGKEFRIGQKLLDHLIKWSEYKEINEIFLGTTEKFIAAQRFYEKNGFKEIEKNKLPEEFPVMHVDVKFYTLLVSNKR